MEENTVPPRMAGRIKTAENLHVKRNILKGRGICLAKEPDRDG